MNRRSSVRRSSGLRAALIVFAFVSVAGRLAGESLPDGQQGLSAQDPVPQLVDQHGRVGVEPVNAGRSPQAFGGEPPPAGESTLAVPVFRPLPPLEPAALVTTPGFSEKWRWVVFGSSVGSRGLQVADLDGDGSNEVLSTGTGYSSGAYAYVLQALNGEYVQRWVVPGNDYAYARAAQLDADSPREILVGNAAEIRVYDGASHLLESSFATAAGSLSGLEAADVDADGEFEVVVIDQSDLYLYHLNTGVLEAQKLGFGGRALALGQIDADPQLEIGVAGLSGSGLVLDGVSLSAQWGRASGFGATIAFGDLDGDGFDEVATSVSEYPFTGVRVFDPGTDSLLYETAVSYSLGALGIGDVTGTSRAELVVSDFYEVSVRDGMTGAELWSVGTGGSGVSAIALGDADNDGIAEIAWGGGGTSAGSQTLRVADAASHQVEWEGLDLNGPFYALDAKDLDGNGQVEVIAGCFESDHGYDDGRYLFLAGANGAQQYLSGPTTGANWTGLWQVRAGNLDSDPQLEVCVTTGVYYTGRIICYDSVTHAEAWHVDLPDGLVPVSLEIADVDGNATLEVVAGTIREHTGAPGTYAYAFSGSAGLLVWRSPDLANGYWSGWPYLRVTELDGDPQREVLLGSWGGGFAVVRGESGTLDFLSPGNLEITAVATPDRDRNGIAELLVGTDGGSVLRLDPTNASILATVFSGYPEPINGLAVADLDGNEVDDYAFGVGMQLVVKSGRDLSTLFTSDVLGLNAGALDAVKVVELDGDTSPELLINTGPGIAVFDAPGALLFSDGFESGDLSLWSYSEPAVVPGSD